MGNDKGEVQPFPCPFCGSEPEVLTTTGLIVWLVRCLCKDSPNVTDPDSREQAIDRWNAKFLPKVVSSGFGKGKMRWALEHFMKLGNTMTWDGSRADEEMWASVRDSAQAALSTPKKADEALAEKIMELVAGVKEVSRVTDASPAARRETPGRARPQKPAALITGPVPIRSSGHVRVP